MRLRPFRLLTDTERAGRTAAFERAVRDWASDWIAGDLSAVRARELPEAELRARLEGDAVEWKRGGTADAWCAVAASTGVHGLARAVFGISEDAGPRPRMSALAAEVVEQAVEGLFRAFGCEGTYSSGPPPVPLADLWGPGSACPAGEVSVGQAKLLVVLSPAWALRGTAAQRHAEGPRLEARAKALGDRPVELRLVAGSVELALSDLVDLRVGDVVTLDTRATDPMALVVAAGTTATRLACKGHMGMRRGRRVAVLEAREG